MKDILLTGNLSVVTNSFIQRLYNNWRIILCGNTMGREYRQKKVVPYDFREDDNEFRGIFKSYDLGAVVFISRSIDGQKRMYDELERLENTLYCAGLSRINTVIYITANDCEAAGDSVRSRLIHTCEDLCKKYGEDNNADVTVVKIPYIFSAEDTGCTLERAVKQILEENCLSLAGERDETTDFISDEDLAELIVRILDEPPEGYQETAVGGGNKVTFEDLAEIIQSVCGKGRVTYSGYREAVPKAVNDGIMREVYGWFALESLENVIPAIVEKYREKKLSDKKKGSLKGDNSAGTKRGRNLIKIKKTGRIIIEMASLFILSEWIGRRASLQRIDYVDFRLLFVVIMGTVHGAGAGITASVLASLGYFSRDIMGSNLQIIFFNIENWLPFAAYFLCGTIVGHVRDKNRESIRFLEQQQKILEDKYIFLNELYGKTLENKEDFNRQILGYQDSFGKIYKVVKKLNSTVPDRIFYEAVAALEEILQVDCVAIYTISGNSHFARLSVSSRKMNGILSKSMDLSNYDGLWEALQDNKDWYNVEGKKDFPIYAYPVIRNDSLIGMICLWYGTAAQMKMEFHNKFSIICGLVQDALIRAIEYTEGQEEKMMIPGTRIMKAAYFEQTLNMKKQLGKDGMSDYKLLKVQAENMDLKEISDAVSSSIRNTDSIGECRDGSILLLLNQADSKSVRLVKDRLVPKGIFLS